jgi:hypothetical protein
MGGELFSGCGGLRKFGAEQTSWDQLLGSEVRTVRFLLITNLESGQIPIRRNHDG